MSDLEFDVLDELYFIIHYKDLLSVTGLDDEDLEPVLTKLLRKGWLRCYSEPDEEIGLEAIDLEISFRNYYYLASKEGLKEHNNT